jgi:subtilisin family serine protease
VPLPDRIFAQVSPTSIGGQSLFSQGRAAKAGTAGLFSSLPAVTYAATQRMLETGFEILEVNARTFNIAGPPDLYEKVLRTKIVEKEVDTPNGPSVTFLDSPDTEVLGLLSTAGTPFGDVIEGVALEVPRRYFAASARPPDVGYWHLKVPQDVAFNCNAAQLHRMMVTGHGVRVAMVDSGWFRHPFFDEQGYDVAPVVLGPGASDPDRDESGHGTGESANILAIAPQCRLLPVKANFVNTTGAFNAAAALGPDIITCSWGSHTPFTLSAADMVLAASVAAAVESGIIVIFSAGNGHAGFPGQHPDVISAGGVFLGPDGSLQASDYSSGFSSLIYPGRVVPDVCGLVGMRPKAMYILLPVEPGDNIDTGNAGGAFPDGDETAPDDGWAAFSGTSAAAPQLAGVAALMKQVAPLITPAQVRQAMASTARDVAAGSCSPVGGVHMGLPAAPGPDGATGPGLVDAFAAVVQAYLGSFQAVAVAGDPWSRAVAAYYQGVADAWTIAVAQNPALAAYLQYYAAVAGMQPPGGQAAA